MNQPALHHEHHEPHGRCKACGYPAHCYPFGWQHVGSGMYSCPDLRPEVSCCLAHKANSRPSCPDDGTCHHECSHGACFRVTYCEPLSSVFPNDKWPVPAVGS